MSTRIHLPAGAFIVEYGTHAEVHYGGPPVGKVSVPQPHPGACQSCRCCGADGRIRSRAFPVDNGDLLCWWCWVYLACALAGISLGRAGDLIFTDEITYSERGKVAA